MGLSLHAHADSHPGMQHPRNEDSVAIAPQPDGSVVLLLCDGMGGMGRGDQASRLGILRVLEGFARTPGDTRAKATEAVGYADTELRERLCVGGRGHAGSTVALAHIADDVLRVGWAGDSRVYHVRGGVVATRTKDHKLVAELVELGQLTPEEAKKSTLSSVITRALGGRPPGGFVTQPAFLDDIALQVGDRIVLSSDGMADLVTDEELPELLAGTPEEAVARLIQTACDRGGHDNISVIVCHVNDEGAPPMVPELQAGAVVNAPDPTPVPAGRSPALPTMPPAENPMAAAHAPAAPNAPGLNPLFVAIPIVFLVLLLGAISLWP